MKMAMVSATAAAVRQIWRARIAGDFQMRMRTESVIAVVRQNVFAMEAAKDCPMKIEMTFVTGMAVRKRP